MLYVWSNVLDVVYADLLACGGWQLNNTCRSGMFELLQQDCGCVQNKEQVQNLVGREVLTELGCHGHNLTVGQWWHDYHLIFWTSMQSTTAPPGVQRRNSLLSKPLLNFPKPLFDQATITDYSGTTPWQVTTERHSLWFNIWLICLPLSHYLEKVLDKLSIITLRRLKSAKLL